MANAFPMALRERIVAAYDRGEGGSTVLARRFSVSRGFICNLLNQRRETGSIAPKQYRRGAKRKLSDSQRDRLIELAGQRPDLTLAELRRRLRLPVGVTTVHEELKRAGYSFKRKAFKLASNAETTCEPSVSVGPAG